MTEPRQFLIKYGAPIVFGAVFVEQIGLPLPAMPWLLAVGALGATGMFNPTKGVLMATLACLLADIIWFYLGRFQGTRVLNLLCRISLEPDSCVRRTQNVFTKYGWRGIVVAKFVPGLSTVAPPLAGMSGLSIVRFLLIDSVGSLLYGGCFIYLGFLFSGQIQKLETALVSIGGSAIFVVAVIAVIYVGFKWWQRRRLLDELKMARISVDDLRQKQDAGEKPFILDLRSTTELHRDPVLIEGAVHLTMDDIEKRHYNIPADRDVVVYCSCPNEITAARVALMLKRHGFTRVHPLLGGIDAWRDQNYPLIRQVFAETAPSEQKGGS